MTTPHPLAAQVAAALGQFSQAYLGHAQESDLYEAALFACARDAIVGAGGQPQLHADGRPTNGPLHFRSSPGNLWSGQFTYLRATFSAKPGKVLEAHLGARVVGASTVAHECDIALIDGDECDRSRSVPAHPRRQKVIAAIEAKCYAAPPGIGVGRGFLGFSQEIGADKCYLVFPSAGSSNVLTLVARRASECLPLVQLGSSHAGRLSGLLEQQIRNWLAR